MLAKHWPDVPRFTDIREFALSSDNLAVDVICGGFPCQDVSLAGKGAGLDGERSGLWREFARVIRVLRPRYVVIENVAALLVRGFDRVLSDIAALGFDAEWQVIPAASVGAPHLRERLFVVAYHRKERAERFFTKEISRFSSFSWSKNVRRVEDYFGRHDIPPPLFRGSRDGIPSWVDRVGSCGNAVVPQIAEWIGRRLMEFECIA